MNLFNKKLRYNPPISKHNLRTAQVETVRIPVLGGQFYKEQPNHDQKNLHHQKNALGNKKMNSISKATSIFSCTQHHFSKF